MHIIKTGNLDSKNFEYGYNRKWLCYSLNDLCQIADFDFFANPFVPAQPLTYYDKFLKPLHDVLAAYKLFWSNSLYAGYNNPIEYLRYLQLPEFEKDDTIWQYDGPDKVAYLQNMNNWTSILQTHDPEKGVQQINGDENTLGYQLYFQTQNDFWSKYGEIQNWDDYQLWEDWVYTGVAIRNKQDYIFPFVIPSNIPYKVYLYATSNLDGGWNPGYYDNNLYANDNYYWKSPYDDVIGPITEGTSKKDQFIKITASLPTPYKINTDMTGIPTDEYYYNLRRPTEDDRYAGIYQEHEVLRVGTVACFYRPIIILDFSTLFDYN